MLVHHFCSEVSYCLIVFTQVLLLEIETSWSQVKTWSSFHVFLENSFTSCLTLTLLLWMDLSDLKPFFLRHYTTPEVKPMLLCNLHVRYFNIIKIMKLNCFVIYPRHSILKFFAKSCWPYYWFRGPRFTRWWWVVLRLIHLIIILMSFNWLNISLGMSTGLYYRRWTRMYIHPAAKYFHKYDTLDYGM